MHGRLRRPPCISSHYYISKRKELTTNSHSRLVVVNSNHPSLPPALIRILCHQKLTTDLRFPAVCRQSNVFFAENAPVKIEVRNKITYFHSVFLLPRPHLALSLGHLALIYPTAAGKLTTERWESRFRRQFLPISRKWPELEAAVPNRVGAVLPAKPYFFAGSRQHAPVFPI